MTIVQIIKAQDVLKVTYGASDYQKLIEKMKKKTKNDLIMLDAIAKDDELSATIRLIAIACMGE